MAAGLLGAAALLTAISTVLSFFGLSKYQVPFVVGLIAVVAAFFCVAALAGYPTQVDRSKGIPRKVPRFSARVRRLFLIPLLVSVAAGAWGVWSTVPRPLPRVGAVKELLENLHKARDALHQQNNGATHDTYRQFYQARIQVGGDFFEDVSIANRIGANRRHLSERNALLLAPLTSIPVQLVPAELVSTEGAIRKPDSFQWLADKRLADALNRVVRNLLQVDELRKQLAEQQGARDSADFRREVELNRTVCAYWERIEAQNPATDLTRLDVPALLAAERRLRSWIGSKHHDTH